MATFRSAQLQNFSLSGAGAVIGDTSITLQSFADINGTLVTMADFGTIGYGTLEPGNGSLEEQISFSGVVQNTNSTATLTGVMSVAFVTPYTSTSGLSKTHAGSTSFVISNTSGFYNQFPAKVNDETITGQWTFTNTPIVPGTVSDASTTVKGVSKLSVAALLSTNPIVVGDNDTRIPQNSYATDTGAANAYVITLTPAPAAYTAGQIFAFKAAHANTTTSTLNVNGLGTQTIKLPTGANLGANTIIIGQIVEVRYDSTNFQMISPPGNLTVTPTNYQAFTSSGMWTKPTGLTGNEIVVVQAWGAGGGGNVIAAARGGGGGGGGGYATQEFLASTLGATETVTLGIGGTVGVAGTNTTFGSWLTAYGGGFGAIGQSSGNAASGGGGGGGLLSVGSNAVADVGGAGGTPGGGAAGISSTGAGGGGSASAGAGAAGAFGGGGGGASSAINTNAGAVGGASVYGGGGGGAGSNSGGTAAGGTSVFGGAGGAGNSSGGSNGVAPGGGGGGGGTTAGSGARGEVRVWMITS